MQRVVRHCKSCCTFPVFCRQTIFWFQTLCTCIQQCSISYIFPSQCDKQHSESRLPLVKGKLDCYTCVLALFAACLHDVSATIIVFIIIFIASLGNVCIDLVRMSTLLLVCELWLLTHKVKHKQKQEEM